MLGCEYCVVVVFSNEKNVLREGCERVVGLVWKREVDRVVFVIVIWGVVMMGSVIVKKE